MIFLKHKLYLLTIILLMNFNAVYSAIIIDHTCTDPLQIPDDWINQAKSRLHIAYQHTSHGSQLITGMNALRSFPAFGTRYDWDDTGTRAGALDLDDYGIPGCADLSQGDYTVNDNDDTPWVIATRNLLDNPANYHINVIVWSWCNIAGHSMSLYLSNMEKLISEYGTGGTNPRAAAYPVQFVFMTAHANGGGEGDSSDSQNQIIRQHCIANNRILFDFSDIENYDPDGNYYLDKLLNDALYYDSDGNGSRDANWATEYLAANPGSEHYYLVKGTTGYTGCASCAHSGSATSDETLNCVLKGRAAWWLWARLAGWSGNSCLPSPADLTSSSDSLAGEITLNWADNPIVPDEDSFIVQRQINSGAWNNVYQVLAQGTTSFVDTGLSVGTYNYRVVAHLDNDGTGAPCDSSPSNIVTEEIIDASPPMAPSITECEANAADRQITIIFQDLSSNETGFIIQRQFNSEQWNESYDTIPAGSSSYTDVNLTPGTYNYRVTAYNDFGQGVSSSETCVLLDIPLAPSALVAGADFYAGTITLNWADNSDSESGFIIQRRVDSGEWNDNYDTVIADVTSYVDDNMGSPPLPGGTYTYRITAYNNNGNSNSSNETFSVISTVVPTAPSGLQAVLDQFDISLSWTDNSDNEERFVLERKINNGHFSALEDNLPLDTQSYNDESLSAVCTYTYRVKAVNGFGESDYSNEVPVYIPNESFTVRLETTSDVDDAFLSSSNSTTNYGNTSYVSVIDNYIVKFNLPASLENQRILEANLGLYGWAQTGFPEGEYLDVYRVVSDWTETQVTWNNASTAQPWVTQGGDYAPVLVGQTEFAGGADHAFFPEIDLTALVQQWVDGDISNYGLMVVNNSSEETGLKASEYSNERRTYLEITYCSWIKGDVNIDGVVDSLDVSACQNYILNTQTLTSQGLINADMNEDGEINVLDLVAIVNIVQ